MAGQGTPASGANCAGRMRVCGGGDSGSCAEWGLLLSGEARLSLGITLVSNTFARIALQLALMDYSLLPGHGCPSDFGSLFFKLPQCQ